MSRARFCKLPSRANVTLNQRRIGLEQSGWNRMKSRAFATALISIAFAAVGGAHAQQQVIGAPPETSNMKLVGYNDLQGRSAYQPTIHHQGDRWIAYIGHHGGTDEIPDPVNPMTGKAEPNGTSIVDVTDPAHPK